MQNLLRIGYEKILLLSTASFRGDYRLVLTLPWIMTKNIWVSTGAHIVNDWLLFLMSLLGASLVGKV